MISISILGCTGSIGSQALALARLHPELIRVAALTAHHNAEQLLSLVREFRPRFAGLTGTEIPPDADTALCDWESGPHALETAAEMPEADAVLVAVSGMTGIRAVLAAARKGKRVLLANKEALVAGGSLVMRCFSENGKAALIPVDSEHSAIWQCLEGAHGNTPAELLLTASGGPFRTWKKEEMRHATVAQALGHPNWSMGKKITVDSATMFNKALEIIEARWLFDMPQSRIRVLVHPQSILHSAVRFCDGTVIGQMGIPDMRLPILYAITWPERMESGTEPLDLIAIGRLTFEEADTEKFPSLRMARNALDAKGNACCVLNAANEEAANAFLRGIIPLNRIFDTVDHVLNLIPNREDTDIEEVFDTDRKARKAAEEYIRSVRI